MERPFEKVVRVIGSQAEVGRLLGVSRGRVGQFLGDDPDPLPARYAPVLERATRERGDPVLCEELCPGVEWHVVRGGGGVDAPHAPTLEAGEQSANRPEGGSGIPPAGDALPPTGDACTDCRRCTDTDASGATHRGETHEGAQLAAVPYSQRGDTRRPACQRGVSETIQAAHAALRGQA